MLLKANVFSITYLMLWIRRIVAVGLLHDVLSPAQGFLPLPFRRVVRLPNSLFVTKAAAAVRLRVGVATGFSGILINEIFILFKLFAILSLTNLNSHLVTANLPKIASKNLKSFKQKKFGFFFQKMNFHLFSSIVHHTFRVFQHLLTPKFEEVRGISVELQTVFTVLSERKESQKCLQTFSFIKGSIELDG
jgi:hypothetical protein